MAVKVIDIRDDIDHTDDVRKRHRKLVLEEAMEDPSAFALEHQLDVASASEGTMAKVALPPKREFRFAYGFDPFGEQGRGVGQSNIPQESDQNKGGDSGGGSSEDENSDQQEKGDDQEQDGEVNQDQQEGDDGDSESEEEQEGDGSGEEEQEREVRIHRGMEIGRVNENKQSGGQAQFGFGEGEEIGESQEEGPESNEGGDKAGTEPGKDTFDAEFPIDDLRDKISDEFELPELDPRSLNVLKTKKISRPYGIRSKGPLSRINQDKTMEAHDRRVFAEVAPDKEDSEESWRPEDFKFRRNEPDDQYMSNLVMYLCHDSSGSIDKEKLKIILALALHWVRAGRKTHAQVALEFITFDAEAKQRTEWEFLYRESGGGTKISTGSDMILELEREKYRRDDWNSMVIFFTDGENQGDDMTNMYESFKKCCEFAKFFAYYEVRATSSTVISASEVKSLEEEFDHFVPFSIKEKEDVADAFMAVVEAIKEANRKKEVTYG